MSLLDEARVEPEHDPFILTAKELEALPAGERYELIRGELCAMPNNSAEHGYVTMRISSRIALFVEENDLGACFAAETRFTIEQNPDTVLGPDFAFVSAARLAVVPRRGYINFAPDLVIEILSPSESRTQFALKIARWLNAGSTIVLVVEPALQAVTLHRTGTIPVRLLRGDTLTVEDILPGFALPLDRVFRAAFGSA